MTLQQNNVKIQINLPTKFKYFQLIRKAKKGILSKERRRMYFRGGGNLAQSESNSFSSRTF